MTKFSSYHHYRDRVSDTHLVTEKKSRSSKPLENAVIFEIPFQFSRYNLIAEVNYWIRSWLNASEEVWGNSLKSCELTFESLSQNFWNEFFPRTKVNEFWFKSPGICNDDNDDGADFLRGLSSEKKNCHLALLLTSQLSVT